MKTANFKAEAKGKTLRLEIYDTIGPGWLGMIDGKVVSEAVHSAGDVKSIDVHINSGGGSVFEGVAIYNILKDHPANVRVKVDGVAASIASIIAMAGDSIEIPKNALFMIHNPSAFAWGESKDLQKTVDLLGKVKSQLVETYAERSKKSADEISQMMDDETWFTGEEAVEAGFADKHTKAVAVSNAVGDAGQFPYRRAPENFYSLVAMATSKPPTEKPVMAEKTQAEIDAETKAAAEVKAKADAEAKERQDAAVKAAADTERKRATDIVAVCKQAGKPDLAAGYVENGADLATVQAALFKALCDERKPVDDGKGGEGSGADENAGYKAEYAKNKALYAGMSEADFVKVRRLEDGKDVLKTKPAAA